MTNMSSTYVKYFMILCLTGMVCEVVLGVVRNVWTDFNTIHPTLKFTLQCETNNQINFLDSTIHRTPTNWRTAVHRKPTFTDTIIPYTSNHPTQHKYATVRFLYNRLYTITYKMITTQKLPPSRTSCTTMPSRSTTRTIPP